MIVCESGNDLAQITASCLAFATDSSFLVIPRFADEERDELLEEIFSLGEGNFSEKFVKIDG